MRIRGVGATTTWQDLITAVERELDDHLAYDRADLLAWVEARWPQIHGQRPGARDTGRGGLRSHRGHIGRRGQANPARGSPLQKSPCFLALSLLIALPGLIRRGVRTVVAEHPEVLKPAFKAIQ